MRTNCFSDVSGPARVAVSFFFFQVQLGQRVGNLMTSVVVCIALEHEDKLVIKMCSVCSGMSNVTCSDANAICNKTALIAENVTKFVKSQAN